ncbi:peptidase C65 Otubain-domain-containing protein [Nemania sp. NC0429]|nr:peptidase C65 Otubain-domain-containing protein [Nemania sp. NC0429]
MGMGMGIGMFQPQPTPFSAYDFYIANAGLPEYAFTATPLLGQFSGGHVVGSTTSNSDGGVVGGIGGMGGMGGIGGRVERGGAPTAGVFMAVHDNGGPAGLGAGGLRPVQPGPPVQGIGSTAIATAGSNSTGYHSGGLSGGNNDNSNSSSSSSIHPLLMNIPMPVSVPYQGQQEQQQHQQPQQQYHQQYHQQHPPPQPQPQQPPPPPHPLSTYPHSAYPHPHPHPQPHPHSHPHPHPHSLPPQPHPQPHLQSNLRPRQPLLSQHQLRIRHQHQPQLHHPHQHPHPHLADRVPIHYSMDQQLELDPNDIAQQEAAANDFEPQLEGPLVGEKVSSQAITAEYAKADPTYVAKTMALPQTYSHYRPIQGDGNCGWRAIAFAYFEILIKCGDVNLVQDELQRMLGLNKYIEDVGGQDPTIFESMVEETFLLFTDIITAMSEGSDPMPILTAKFNDLSVSQCLVYHLRLLAGARLKGDAAKYQNWLDSDVESYLQTTVMPVNREIDHICVVLVHDVLLKPANIVLEIAYLDRSEGTEVNVHRFPAEATGQDFSTLGPVIYLLYRPGHYDILYREMVAPPAPAPVDLQIATSLVQGQIFQGTASPYRSIDMSPLSVIPGLQNSSLSTLGLPSTTPPPMADPYAPSPAPSWVSAHFPSEIISPPTPSQPSPAQGQGTVHPLRFSKYNFPNLPEMAAESNSSYEPAFMTNTFKNSHYNKAHYNNQDFQPEMYQPDAEEEALSSANTKMGGRKRSIEHCLGIKKEK